MKIDAEIRFAIIPEWVLYSPTISNLGVRVYGALARHADKAGWSHPSRKRIGELIGCSEASVKRAVAELLEAGAIEVRERQGTSNQYLLRYSEGVGSPATRVTHDPGVGSPMTRGVGSPVTHELEPIEREPRNENAGEEPATVDRPDVERLCTLLADLIEGNGARRPTITKAWRDAARLLLDKDGIPYREAVAGIRWCQADSFWRANILSMPKYRDKFDQLRLQAQRRTGHRGTAGAMMEQAFKAQGEG